MRRLRVRNAASSRHRLRLLSLELGLGQADSGLDRRQIDLLAALQPLVELRQGEMGRLGRRGRAGDCQPVAARDQRDAELPLDAVEMLVALAIEQRQEQIVVEFELAACGRGSPTISRDAPLMPHTLLWRVSPRDDGTGEAVGAAA